MKPNDNERKAFTISSGKRLNGLNQVPQGSKELQIVSDIYPTIQLCTSVHLTAGLEARLEGKLSQIQNIKNRKIFSRHFWTDKNRVYVAFHRAIYLT